MGYRSNYNGSWYLGLKENEFIYLNLWDIIMMVVGRNYKILNIYIRK